MTYNWIPWVISFLMLIISYLNFLKAGNKAQTEERKEQDKRLDDVKEKLIVVALGIENLSAELKEMRKEIREFDQQIRDIDKRVSALELYVKNNNA